MKQLLLITTLLAPTLALADKAQTTAKKDLEHAKQMLSLADKRRGAEGLAQYQKCLANLDDAVKADPSIEVAAADTRTACAAGVTKSQGFADSHRASPDDSKYGLGIKDGFATATAIAAKKNLEAMELVDGQKGAKACLEGLGRLEATVDANHHSQKLYPFDKATLTLPEGAVTLGEVQQRCKAILTDLGSRKVNGCGTKDVLVTQAQVSANPVKWGAVSFSGGETYDPAQCKDMPKAPKISGTAVAYAGQLKGTCSGGVVVMDDAQWGDPNAASDGSGYRSMHGTCWAKGKLAFKLP